MISNLHTGLIRCTGFIKSQPFYNLTLLAFILKCVLLLSLSASFFSAFLSAAVITADAVILPFTNFFMISQPLPLVAMPSTRTMEILSWMVNYRHRTSCAVLLQVGRDWDYAQSLLEIQLSLLENIQYKADLWGEISHTLLRVSFPSD